MTVRAEIFNSMSDIMSIIPNKFQFRKRFGEISQKLFYGVELEVEFRKYNDDWYQDAAVIRNDARYQEVKLGIATDLEDYAILKPDGHAEIVTVPATLRFHKEQLWNKFFENSVKNVKGPLGCGMHIHFSKEALTNLEIAKFIVFIHEHSNSKFLSDLAGRDVKQAQIWCAQKDPIVLAKMKANMEAPAVFNPLATTLRDAVHISARNGGRTLEVRIFQSSPTKQGIFQGLELVDSLIRYVKICGKDQEELKSHKYLEWFSSRREMKLRYPFLTKNLKRLGYVKEEMETQTAQVG